MKHLFPVASLLAYFLMTPGAQAAPAYRYVAAEPAGTPTYFISIWDIVRGCCKDAAGAGLGALAGGPVGALCGGAASSLATMATPPGSGGGAVLLNRANKFDSIGGMHNRMIFDYWKENRTYSPDAFLRLLEKNKVAYGIEKVPTVGELQRVVEATGRNDASAGEVLDKAAENFRASGITFDVVGRLKRIPIMTMGGEITQDEFAKSVLQIENEALQSKGLNERQTLQLSAFFSVLRHSSSVWWSSPAVRGRG